MPILGIKMPKMGMHLKKTEAPRLRGETGKAGRTDPKVRTSLVDALFSRTQQRVPRAREWRGGHRQDRAAAGVRKTPEPARGGCSEELATHFSRLVPSGRCIRPSH